MKVKLAKPHPRRAISYEDRGIPPWLAKVLTCLWPSFSTTSEQRILTSILQDSDVEYHHENQAWPNLGLAHRDHTDPSWKVWCIDHEAFQSWSFRSLRAQKLEPEPPRNQGSRDRDRELEGEPVLSNFKNKPPSRRQKARLLYF
ncbi:hypothetical protein VNO77_22562 [Canavalia gladiata]|uniref:Uncharacterized protein n=1 Tax=Canavalia gladiata TaxID=3824 RepID=A0AAN9L2U0_CANGL